MNMEKAPANYEEQVNRELGPGKFNWVLIKLLIVFANSTPILLSNAETSVLLKNVIKGTTIANPAGRTMFDQTERYLKRVNLYEQQEVVTEIRG